MHVPEAGWFFFPAGRSIVIHPATYKSAWASGSELGVTAFDPAMARASQGSPFANRSRLAGAAGIALIVPCVLPDSELNPRYAAVFFSSPAVRYCAAWGRPLRASPS